MYALLDENDQLVGGQPVAIYRKPKPITLPDGTQFPANWMGILSTDEKAYYHIYPMAGGSVPVGEIESGSPYTYSFDGSLVTETIATVPAPTDSYKILKIQELTRIRDSEISKPTIITFGATDYAFESTGVARDLMTGVRTAVNSGMAFPANFTWSSIDYDDGQGNVYESTVVSGVTEAQFNQIVQGVLTKEYLAHKQFVELREDVDNATTNAEVDAVQWVYS